MADDVFAVAGVDELYAGALTDFVPRRDELVKQLRKTGDRDAAAAVKELRKPNTVAWAVNQVARADPAGVEALLAAGRDVETAQAKAVRGKGDAGLQGATRQWRNRVQQLASEVARIVGEPYRDDAAATFQAASVDAELSGLLKAGRLTTGLMFAGFGLAAMPDLPDTPAPASDPQERAARAKHDAAAIRDARERLAARETALEKATHSLRRAEQRLEQAETAVKEAELGRADAVAARDEAERVLGRLEAD